MSLTPENRWQRLLREQLHTAYPEWVPVVDLWRAYGQEIPLHVAMRYSTRHASAPATPVTARWRVLAHTLVAMPLEAQPPVSRQTPLRVSTLVRVRPRPCAREGCEILFVPARPRVRWCSEGCALRTTRAAQVAALGPIPPRTCPQCQITFTPKRRGRKATYCSRSCGSRATQLRRGVKQERELEQALVDALAPAGVEDPHGMANGEDPGPDGQGRPARGDQCPSPATEQGE